MAAGSDCPLIGVVNSIFVGLDSPKSCKLALYALPQYSRFYFWNSIKMISLLSSDF